MKRGLLPAMPLRMEKARHFKEEGKILRSLGAGILLHGVLGVPEEEVRTGPDGRPFVPGGPDFNLSHSGDYAVMAVGDREDAGNRMPGNPAEASSGGDDSDAPDDTGIGVDIEKIDPRHLRVAPSVCSEEELDWMAEDSLPRFYLLWSMKESILKAAGRGITVHPLRIRLSPENVLQETVLGPYFCRSLIFREKYALAAALREPFEMPDIREIT